MGLQNRWIGACAMSGYQMNGLGERKLLALRTLLVTCACMIAVGCASQNGDRSTDVSSWVQTAWALRTDTLPAPSAPEGLVRGNANPLEVAADQPFRLRFEIESPTELAPSDSIVRFGLQVRRNDGPWEDVLARDFPYPDGISTPRVSVVHATTWTNGAQTGDLLDGSDATFAGGSAIALDSMSAPIQLLGQVSAPMQTEFEWALVIRRWADGAVTNEEGDTFTFRMIDGAGHPVATRAQGDDAAADLAAANLVLRIPDRLLGGTFVETPGVLGPWQSEDGAMYFPMEPAETHNVLMMMKSSDGGRTWREVDGDNRPVTDDLEGVASAMLGATIYVLHQVSEATYLHAFATGDSMANGDRWVIRDELVAQQPEPPTQVAALVADPEGQLTALYGDSLGLRVRVRATDGTWGQERRIDGPSGAVSSGVMAVRGVDGRTHVAYTTADSTRRDVWYLSVSPEGVPGDPVRVASGVGVREEDVGAVAPLVHIEEAGATVLLYRLNDGLLYSRTVRRDGSLSTARPVSSAAVVQSGSDSEQVGADAIAFEGRVIVAVIDEATRDIHTIEGNVAGSGDVQWSSPKPLVEGVNAQWLRGRVLRDTTGAPVYGIVYDAGSDGGSGLNRFITYPLR